MDFGFLLPLRGALATPETLATLARHGEACGFGILGASDHILFPRSSSAPSPYGQSTMLAGADDHLDMLTVLAYVAAQTSRARLLTSVLVVPHRPPIQTAKVLATIDVLSHGRLIVGAGAGGLREEFEAIGAPPFAERSAVTDEYVQVFRSLWSQDAPEYHGRYASFANVRFAPKPVQRPGIPIWVGGEDPAALRRAGRIGDGWYPIGSNPTYPLQTVQQMAAAVAQVRRHAEDAGRDPQSVDIALQATWFNMQARVPGPDGNRLTFTGSVEEIGADIAAYEAIGVRHLIIPMLGPTLDASYQRMERFNEAFGAG